MPQGSPLSPILFNLAINHILQDLADHEISAKYGYSVCDNLPPISTLDFADDIAIISNNEANAAALLNIAECKFIEIGLGINPGKSKCIILKREKLKDGMILSLQGATISSINNKHERIRYLGIDFTDEISFNKQKLIKKINI